MSGRGGNLKQPLKKVLLNVPGPDNLGTYLDSVSGFRILQFKAHGFSLPWIVRSTLSIQRPVTPVPKVVLATISNVAPVDRMNYEFGFSILGRHREPGVDNSMVFPHQKFYGGVLPFVSTPTISNDELNRMRDQIIGQLNSDIGLSVRRPAYQLPGSAVIAGIPLLLNNWNAASAVTIDGLTIAAGATIAAFVANINARAGYFAVATSATEITVVRNNRINTPIVFAMTLGTIANASGNGQIALLQRYSEQTFEVVTHNPAFATVTTIQNTRFAQMTPDEIYQVFSHIPNFGKLAQQTRNVNAPLNVPFLKLVIDIPMEHYDLGGPSHGVTFENALEVYMPETEWDAAVNRWAAPVANRIMDAGTASSVRTIFALWQT